jgi:hypothetical protein
VVCSTYGKGRNKQFNKSSMMQQAATDSVVAMRKAPFLSHISTARSVSPWGKLKSVTISLEVGEPHIKSTFANDFTSASPETEIDTLKEGLLLNELGHTGTQEQ